MYVGIICGHMDPNPSRTFMSLLDGDDEIEKVERSNTSVPPNTHMQHPPYHTKPNYSYLPHYYRPP